MRVDPFPNIVKKKGTIHQRLIKCDFFVNQSIKKNIRAMFCFHMGVQSHHGCRATIEARIDLFIHVIVP
jgi:hypothetical protein